MSTGNRIQSRREELGLSRHQLAQRLGTTRMSVYRVEKGQRFLNTNTLGEWAAALETASANLLPEDTTVSGAEAARAADPTTAENAA